MNENNPLKRLASPTPKFFKVLRNTFATLAAISFSLMGMENLPPALMNALPWLGVINTVATIISQLPVEENPK